MNPNLAKPLIAVIAATAGLGIWQYARASAPPAPPAAQVAQIDGSNMPADHASHHAVISGVPVLTPTLPGPSQGMGDMMKSGDMKAMTNSADMNAMMKSGDMNAMMKSGDMSAMMKSGDMGAMMDSANMSAADKQACLDADGDMAKMQAHMTQMSKMPGHMQPGTESAK